MSDARTSRLTRPLYTYAAAEEFVLLYPVYALLFTDHGLSVAQISSLFILWSAIGLIATVPAGALADVVPRRYLLATAPLLTGCGYALWLTFPGYACFAAGFALWGLAESLTSGALEALVHTELSHRGAAHRYATIMGITRALGVGAVGAATLVAVPVMSWGGFDAVGIASVAACALCSIAGLALPEHRATTPPCRHPDNASAPTEYRAALRAGVAEARGNRQVRRAVILLIVVTSFWGVLDEYVPLLVSDDGVTSATVPLVLAAIWAGVTIGGLLAGAAERLSRNVFGALLALAALAIGGGATFGGPVGWILLGAGFGACQAASVVADARLQNKITGPSRATVTSLAGLGVDVTSTAAYPLYAAAFAISSHGVAFALFATPYLLAGCILMAVRPKPAKAVA
ncbi:MFS transporter [Gordonia effusa]|uniref:MFS transporter n=1 Tax=Gordonia effusa TaxID=263908 RepID=UPI001FE0FC67|nr:MFS transporter [Gordonia effusa]